MLKDKRNKEPILRPNQYFNETIRNLLENSKDFDRYWKSVSEYPLNTIRCNTLKISPKELIKKLSKKWQVRQPFPNYPEIILVESILNPGELGKAVEHILGYYYVQDISSMMSAVVLNPNENEIVLDLCASPGSKTTYLAMIMKSKGTLIANDVSLGRIQILSTNLQRCGVANAIVTQSEGAQLCKKLKETNFYLDKILVDVPCSCEGVIRSSPNVCKQVSENLIKKLSNIQKNLLASAIKCLKVNGEVIYSTCTHSPEECEEVINYALENFPVELLEVNIPLKTRHGITKYKNKTYNEQVKKCVRIYPHDNHTEGFFIAKLRKLK